MEEWERKVGALIPDDTLQDAEVLGEEQRGDERRLTKC